MNRIIYLHKALGLVFSVCLVATQSSVSLMFSQGLDSGLFSMWSAYFPAPPWSGAEDSTHHCKTWAACWSSHSYHDVQELQQLLLHLRIADVLLSRYKEIDDKASVTIL